MTRDRIALVWVLVAALFIIFAVLSAAVHNWPSVFAGAAGAVSALGAAGANVQS